MKITQLTDNQLINASRRMAHGSDGYEAGKRRDFDAVREALVEAENDGYSIQDFLD